MSRSETADRAATVTGSAGRPPVPSGGEYRVASDRTSSAHRSPGRGSSARDALLWELAGRLTDRDRQLCSLLYEHRVLTTGQIADAAFAGLRKAQRRLLLLHHLEVVDRFRPRSWSGSGPHHFTLGPAGATVVAADRGIPVADLSWRRDAAAALALSQRLGHLVGVNGFFTALLRTARTRGDCALVEWWPERRCAAAWGQLVRPDGYGIWTDGTQRLPFLLEYDTGSERLARLTDKLDGYARLAAAAGHRTWVVFAFPSPGREAAARRMLTRPDVPVATAALPVGASPADTHWLPTGSMGPRRTLAALGHPCTPDADGQRGLR